VGKHIHYLKAFVKRENVRKNMLQRFSSVKGKRTLTRFDLDFFWRNEKERNETDIFKVYRHKYSSYYSPNNLSSLAPFGIIDPEIILIQ
jgi:hypothetical protein